MKEGKNFWLPRSFDPVGLGIRINAFEGLAQMGKADMIRRPYSSHDMYRSINGYIKSLSDSGEITDLIGTFVPKGSGLSPEIFSLLVHHGRGRSRMSEKPFDSFYYDGDVNLLLFYGDPNENLAVTAGLARAGKIKDNSSMSRESKAGLKEDDLIINQLQGATYDANREIQETFSGFRWEKMLVGLISTWARQAGIKNLYLLPSECNRYAIIRENKNGTAFLRYDVTARRTGFRRNDKNGLYALDIESTWRELFDSLVATHQQYP